MRSSLCLSEWHLSPIRGKKKYQQIQNNGNEYGNGVGAGIQYSDDMLQCGGEIYVCIGSDGSVAGAES